MCVDYIQFVCLCLSGVCVWVIWLLVCEYDVCGICMFDYELVVFVCGDSGCDGDVQGLSARGVGGSASWVASSRSHGTATILLV